MQDGTAEPVSRDQIPRHARGKRIFILPVQLTTSRIGDLARLIHTLLYVMTIHTYNTGNKYMISPASCTHRTTQLRLTRVNSFSHNSAVSYVSYATITQWCIFQGGELYEITQWCIFPGVELHKITQWCIFQGGELYKITQWCIFQAGELYKITQWCIFQAGELYKITQWCIFQEGELYKITQWCIFQAGELYKITQWCIFQAGELYKITQWCIFQRGDLLYKITLWYISRGVSYTR